MTRIQALMTLNGWRDRLHEAGIVEELIVFLPVAEEHRDYVLFRAVETDGDYAVERCLSEDCDSTTLCRVWLTPEERAARLRKKRSE